MKKNIRNFTSMLLIIIIILGVIVYFPKPVEANSTEYLFLSADSFSNTNVSNDDSKPIKISEDARVIDGGVELVSTANSQKGGVFLTRPLSQNTGFSTAFHMYMGAKGGGGDGAPKAADGFTLVVAHDTNAIGGDGRGLGYEGITNSIAIEYDTFENQDFLGGDGWGSQNHPTLAPHIELARNGVAHNDVNFPSTIYTPVADMAVLKGTHNKYSGGENYHLYGWAEYDAEEHKLYFYLSLTENRPNEPLAEYTINLADYAGETYHIGFTASTGGASQEITLKEWYVSNEYVSDGLSFSNEYEQDNAAPSASTITITDDGFTVGGSTDTGGSELEKYQYKLYNDIAWTNYTSEVAVDSETYVYARAIDNAGNISSATREWCGDIESKPSIVSYSVDMHDGFGDGWNGNKLIIVVDEVEHEITLEYGTDSTYEFDALRGTSVEIYFDEGEHSEEISFEIYNSDANELIYSLIEGDAEDLPESSTAFADFVAMPEYEIDLTPRSNKDFGTVIEEYQAQTAYTLTVENIGDEETGDLTISLTGTNASAFTISKTTINSLEPDETDTFTVNPNNDLSVGDYTATVTVSGINVGTKTFNVSFSVDPEPVTSLTDNDVIIEGMDETTFDGHYLMVIEEDMEEDFESQTNAKINEIIEGNSIISLFDISLYLQSTNAKITEFQDFRATIKIPLTDELKEYENLQIVYIDDDGDVEHVSTTVNEDFIEFEVTHLSDYAITGILQNEDNPEIEVPTITPEVTNSPEVEVPTITPEVTNSPEPQVPTVTPEVTNSPTPQDPTTTPDTSTNQSTDSPKTGDINISLVIVTTLISIFVILISAKRVKNKKK
ncbi:MAG: hypothetical protein LBL91_01070 [Lachnospiraceae bacterium]|nr:hypothetical protein [Lachnospiraceae bacterium]